ncbi:MAG: 2-oxoacid:acceptor oxidoreductase family protein [Coriobacteriales bacterium]|jgi:indolepyruvate ferredoxin oxidoreductase beta subunit|nr:2-oxoacid:acceptor oxidoreductase family protein [Coriobacteriales bacterium]
MPESPLNIIVSGVGGQGTVLAGKLLAQCALASGACVRSAETIGMAQRGGSVLGHVRIASPGCPPPASPLVPAGEAQLLIGFEPAEALRAYGLCAPGALVVCATAPLLPPTASLQRTSYDGRAQLAALAEEEAAGRIAALVLVDNAAVLATLGFNRALNVVLLGTALATLEASGHACPAIRYDAMRATLATSLAPQYLDPNLQALEIGYTLPCR